ncbi:C-C motif chemokine 4-like [Oncorhynchus mykiss]|uniref:Chemokine interleukin-8-like domain-containing protein n=1 Tax=Oncorhynchus mykiss TaxID=8022 RepID=A0A8K9XZT1_ONCMY|nr:C-C motif chemokine 4-like [Oncorhynchus mykiss]
MKTLTALLLLGLLCSLHTTSAQPVMGISAMTARDCCVKFSPRRIPLGAVVSVSRTPSSCPRQALVFTTKKGNRFCVDPSQAWVQSHVTNIESRSLSLPGQR